jgi:4-hydroxybutyrate CoA-transferase
VRCSEPPGPQLTCAADRKRTDLYRDRVVSADMAMTRISNATSLFVHSGCGEPQTLVESLVANRGIWRGLRILTGLQGAAGAYTDPRYTEHFRPELFMVNRAAAAGLEQGTASYVPCGLSEIPALISRDGVDVAFVQVSPPNRQGYCTLGVTVAYTKAALSVARLVVAEVNQRMPRTCGDTIVHESELDLIVESDRPVLEVTAGKVTTDLSMIGSAVVGLIPDRASVQVGIGAAAESAWTYLAQRPELHIHTGSISDAAIPTIDAQAATGGPVIASQLIGSSKLYEYAHENPDIELHQVSRTHDPRHLGTIDRFVAINSALEVDLRGQANSEMLAGGQVSAGGGAVDFGMGSFLSRGGFSVIALASTTSRGSSRIVPRLTDGVVTLPSALVDFVVTEQGIADLRGRSLDERAQALVCVAAPQHREELSADRARPPVPKSS